MRQSDLLLNELPRGHHHPPFARVYVECSRFTSASLLYDAFRRYGRLEFTVIVRERRTHEPSGVAYVKYERASSAALAVLKLNGRSLAPGARPLRVMISSVTGVHDDPPALEQLRNRLYIKMQRGMVEEDLRRTFSQFDGYCSCYVVKDPETRVQRNFAFVTFFDGYQAAVAMERCPLAIHVTLADPPPERRSRANDSFPRPLSPAGRPRTSEVGDLASEEVKAALPPSVLMAAVNTLKPLQGMALPVSIQTILQLTAARASSQVKLAAPPPSSDTMETVASNKTQLDQAVNVRVETVEETVSEKEEEEDKAEESEIKTTNTAGAYMSTPAQAQEESEEKRQVYVTCLHSSVTRQQLRRLFDVAPGMKAYQLKRHHGKEGRMRAYAYVTYGTAEQAQYAVEKFDGLEYPPGQPLDVQLAEEHKRKVKKRSNEESEPTPSDVGANEEEVVAAKKKKKEGGLKADTQKTKILTKKRKMTLTTPASTDIVMGTAESRETKQRTNTMVVSDVEEPTIAAATTTTCPTPEPPQPAARTAEEDKEEEEKAKTAAAIGEEEVLLMSPAQNLDKKERSRTMEKGNEIRPMSTLAMLATAENESRRTPESNDLNSEKTKPHRNTTRLFYHFKPACPPLVTIESVFARYGPMKDCVQIRDTNYGFATFVHASDGQRAMENVHGLKLMGNTLSCYVANEHPSRNHEHHHGRDEALATKKC